MPKFESTLRFSNYFAFIQLVMLSGSVTMTLFLNFSLLIKMLACFLLCGYSFWIFYQQMRWQGIGHDTEGWYLQTVGEKIPVIFHKDSTVTSFVSIVRFKPGKFLKPSCVIFKDSLPKDVYRELVVRIKYY
jgi:hypothetical protein